MKPAKLARVRLLYERRNLLTNQFRMPGLSLIAIASDCEDSGCVRSRGSDCVAESSSRWLSASFVSESGRPEESSRLTMFTTWGAALLAGAMAMGFERGDGGVVCSEGAERTLFSPMGKIPESKLAQTHFFLSEEFRRRIFFNYERRLRMRSPPEKVFQYFSSVRNGDGHFFMTAGDLMRATVPVFPPTGSHMVRGGHLQGERNPGELKCSPSKFFMLFDTNGDGLISFPEYIFFITLLSIPEKNFSATFRMFDLDENGMIDRAEFKKVMTWMRAQTRVGKSHTHGLRTGLGVSKDIDNAGMVEFFFGTNGNRQLPLTQFERFLKELHEEIIRLEFAHYDYDNRGTISATDFGLSMAASADLSKLHHYLDRVHDLSTDAQFSTTRITLEEFLEFAQLRKKIPVLAMAISSFGKIQGKLTKNDVQRAAVKRRESDIADPTETGVIQFLKCLWRCSRHCQKPWL
ncbi:calcium uptake protein, mitochondrial isoform X2 [Physcomitrium patens]|uniref:EF-hand domain-containing protein n=1 Tax=Physcomitrium patens TaxID=3218 RepID=A0A7I4DD55_PHYPA|nr:calcium uptake protein, mitochondrial-like isoform X2 [Physcomitrium patens]|eukprot:XP_024398218.1 calcium uptake protein, mitochondrial-like isoform X2 [Physcomitrella patens]